MEIEMETIIEQQGPQGVAMEGITNGNVAGQVIQQLQGPQGQSGASQGTKGATSSKK
jgi:hypothetical protein